MYEKGIDIQNAVKAARDIREQAELAMLDLCEHPDEVALKARFVAIQEFAKRALQQMKTSCPHESRDLAA